MLKTFVSAAAVVATLGISGAAFGQEVIGVIRSYEPSQRVIILEDGTRYMLSEGVTIQQYQPGTKVRYIVEDRGGTRYITKIITSD
jgi:hypothetical protein